MATDDFPEGTAPLRKVRMSETLALQLGADRVAWGEPDAEGFYTPTLYIAGGMVICPNCGKPLNAPKAALS